jgi:hypothetical protein
LNLQEALVRESKPSSLRKGSTKIKIPLLANSASTIASRKTSSPSNTGLAAESMEAYELLTIKSK